MDEAALEAEVRAFASQLGFAGTGGGGGFDASDFEPSKARQKLGSGGSDGDPDLPSISKGNKRKRELNPSEEGARENGSAHQKKAKDAKVLLSRAIIVAAENGVKITPQKLL